jgi:hypothetical protein
LIAVRASKRKTDRDLINRGLLAIPMKGSGSKSRSTENIAVMCIVGGREGPKGEAAISSIAAFQ